MSGFARSDTAKCCAPGSPEALDISLMHHGQLVHIYIVLCLVTINGVCMVHPDNSMAFVVCFRDRLLVFATK